MKLPTRRLAIRCIPSLVHSIVEIIPVPPNPSKEQVRYQAIDQQHRIHRLMSQYHQLQSYLASIDCIKISLDQYPGVVTEDTLNQVQTIVQGVDSIGFFHYPNLVDQHIQVLSVIQRLVYVRHDIGPVLPTVAEWCLQRWLWIAQCHPQNARIMQGIGSWWLCRAQPSLVRIHAIDGSSSSSGGQSSNSRVSSVVQPPTGGLGNVQDSDDPSDDEEDEIDTRINTADYVEARGFLLPAIDYLRRAVETIDAAGQEAAGQLLSMTAEAYMSMGNVSSPRANFQYFRQAIHYLRRASSAREYTLPAHLQRYLDDYGRYAD